MSETGLAVWTIVVGALGNAACALLGCYLVLRRISLLGDAISHAILPGIAVAFLLAGRIAAVPMFLGAVVVGLLTAFLSQALSSFGRVSEDTSLGVVFTSLFALGVLLITNVAANVDLDPGCVLYGLIEFTPLDTVNLLGFEIPRAVLTLAPVLAVTIGFIALFWKELLISTFDAGLASAMGLSANVVHYLLMAMVAVVTVASFEAVGSILVIAMLIVPAATAHLLTDRLMWMLGIAVAIGVASSVLGYFGAVWWNTSVAGMMAVTVGAIFGLAVLLAPRHGVLVKLVRTLDLALRIRGEDVLAALYRREESHGEGEALPARDASRAAGGGNLGRLALMRLRRQGLLTWVTTNALGLTAMGRVAGHDLIRAHRLWEIYLYENFSLPLDHVHEPASRIEHYLGPDLREKLAAELASPPSDPHGRAIPRPPSDG